MSYTFLDVKADSVGDDFRDKMMAMIAERTSEIYREVYESQQKGGEDDA